LDYDEQQAELAARGLGAATLAGLSIEQSKFLGGDLAHTHLVKGLDYALLQQARPALQRSSGREFGGFRGNSARGSQGCCF
jgi:IK cytokine